MKTDAIGEELMARQNRREKFWGMAYVLVPAFMLGIILGSFPLLYLADNIRDYIHSYIVDDYTRFVSQLQTGSAKQGDALPEFQNWEYWGASWDSTDSDIGRTVYDDDVFYFVLIVFWYRDVSRNGARIMHSAVLIHDGPDGLEHWFFHDPDKMAQHIARSMAKI